MNISITLVHNKTDAENQAQIESLKSLLNTIEDIHDEFDENGEVVGQFSTFHQEFIGLNIPHVVKIYQVIPFGVTPPENRGDINSGGIVYYGKGDEDKVGDHPRFFNWGAKRGIDQGADVSLYIDDVSKLNVTDLRATLNSKPEFKEETFGKVISKEEFGKGQLDEKKSLKDIISEKKGVKRG